MSDTSVDETAVRHVAELARLGIDDAEAGEFAEQFAELLERFEALDEVPAVEREPELTNVLRPDESRPGLSQAAALRNAPETEDGQFKGPKVS